MLRIAPLRLTSLEAREVPATGLFADIHPGIWGSYPKNLTTSGQTLFFSADDGHGYELYSTNGKPESTHVVKDIRPGIGGSDPDSFFAADGGVVYFTASPADGTRSLFRSDGTTAGTTKVLDLPANVDFGTSGEARSAVGRNGELYFTTTTRSDRDVQFWKTDGKTTTLLRDFGTDSTHVHTSVGLSQGVVTVNHTEHIEQWGWNPSSVWVTDGTPAGTRLQQQPLTTVDRNYVAAALNNGVKIAPGLFVHTTILSYANGNTSTLWASDGLNSSSTKLLVAISTFGDPISLRALVPLNGKAYFIAQGVSLSTSGLWVTDGTPTGTKRISRDVPQNATTGDVRNANVTFDSIQAFGDKILLRSFDSNAGRNRYWLSDGTAIGTTEIPLPSPNTTQWYTPVSQLPVGPEFAKGALVFRLGPQERPYVTDGTLAGGRWLDTTKLPSGYRNVESVYFKGKYYFQAGDGDQRPELWAWDLQAANTTAVVAPRVVKVVVNDGAVQRSMVTRATISFDRTVVLDSGAITIKDAKGNSFPVSSSWELSATGGPATLTLRFPSFSGGSIPDGRYTLTVQADKVHDVATGRVMTANSTFSFTRVYGDLNGDGIYDREARSLVHALLGHHTGDPGFLSALDVNSDGVIDAIDELAVVRNWKKSV